MLRYFGHVAHRQLDPPFTFIHKLRQGHCVFVAADAELAVCVLPTTKERAIPGKKAAQGRQPQRPNFVGARKRRAVRTRRFVWRRTALWRGRWLSNDGGAVGWWCHQEDGGYIERRLVGSNA